jgi:cytochrome P450 family 6
MFGMKFNCLTTTESEVRKQGMKHFGNNYKQYLNILSLFFMPQLTKILGFKFFDSDLPNFFKHLLPKIMSERDSSSIKKKDLIEALNNLHKNHQNKENAFYDRKFSLSLSLSLSLNLYLKQYLWNKNVDNYIQFSDFQLDGLVGTSLVFLLGGFEPSASVTYFILYELSKHPNIQMKLREEILKGLESSDDKITYDLVMNFLFNPIFMNSNNSLHYIIMLIFMHHLDVIAIIFRYGVF